MSINIKWNPGHEPKAKPKRGLGDVVEGIAHPVAEFLDKHFETKLVGCESCAERQARLNKLMPDMRHPFKKETS